MYSNAQIRILSTACLRRKTYKIGLVTFIGMVKIEFERSLSLQAKNGVSLRCHSSHYMAIYTGHNIQ